VAPAGQGQMAASAAGAQVIVQLGQTRDIVDTSLYDSLILG
jgi:hypothetical protein